MNNLIKEAINELAIQLNIKIKADEILNRNQPFITTLLNMPHGGTLSPEELAEIILARESEALGLKIF